MPRPIEHDDDEIFDPAAVGLRNRTKIEANRRVEVTGMRNRILASLVRFMPRTAVLRSVRNLQSPIT